MIGSGGVGVEAIVPEGAREQCGRTAFVGGRAARRAGARSSGLSTTPIQPAYTLYVPGDGSRETKLVHFLVCYATLAAFLGRRMR